MPDPVVPGLPAIASLTYLQGVITVTMDATPSQTVTAALFQGNPSGTGWLASATNTNVVAQIDATSITLDPGVVYTVALTFTPSNPTWGTPVTLVWQTPTLTSIASSPTVVDIGWTMPIPTTMTGVEAFLYDSTGNTTAVAGTSRWSGIRLVPPVPLDPAHTYQILVRGVNGVAAGPFVSSGNLILTSPTVASATYAATSPASGQAVTATPQSVSSPPGSVSGQLLRDDSVVSTQAASPTNVVFTVSSPLDPRSQYQVRLYYVSGVITGPPGVPALVSVPFAPAITSTSYSGAGNVLTVLFAAAPVPRVTAAVFEGAPSGTGWKWSTTTNQNNAEISIDDSAFDASKQYYVALSLDTTANPVVWGPAVLLVWQQPAVSAVNVTSASVDVTWTVPSPTTIVTVDAQLYDTTNNLVIASGSFAASGGRLVPPLPLSATGTYVVMLAGRNGISTSEAVTSPTLIVASPSVASIVYAHDGTNDTVTVTPATVSTPPGTVSGRLLVDGQIVAQQAASGGTVVFTLSQPLSINAVTQVQLYYVSGAITGPPGLSATVNTPPLPAIVSLSSVLGTITATLAAAPVPAATVALFKGTPSGTSWVTSVVTTTAAAQLSVDPQSLDPNFAYSVALSLDTSAATVQWESATVLVWQQPTLTAVHVTPAMVDVTWTLPTTTTIAAVEASLYDTANNITIATGLFAGSGGHLVPPVPLTGGTYIIVAAGRNGISGSAVVASPNLILTSPTIDSVAYAYDGTNDTITVTPVTVSTPPGTVVGQLLIEGQPVAEQTASGGTVVFTLADPLATDQLAQTQLFYQSGIVSGPPGIAATIDTPSLPAITSLLYAAGNINVTLANAPVPAAAVALFKGQPSGTSWIAKNVTATTTAQLSVTPSILDSNFEYIVALSLDTTADPVVWEQAQVLVWQTPTIDSAAMAGEAVEIGWTLPSPTTIAAVEASLYDSANDAIIASGTFTSNGARLVPPVPLSAGASIMVIARGVQGVAAGPTTALSQNLILTSPTVASAVYEPGSTAGTFQITVTPVSVDSPPGTVVAQLLADGVSVAQATASGGTAVLSLTQALDAATSWKVALLYTSSGVSGPLGTGVALPVQSPALVSAEYDGTKFTIAWAPPSGEPGANAALIEIVRTDNDDVVGSATVAAGVAASITPSSIDTTKSYQAQISPIVGSAQGLAAAVTPLLVVKPTLSAVSSDGEQVAISVNGSATGTQLVITSNGTAVLTANGGPIGGVVMLPRTGLTTLAAEARVVSGNVIGPPSAATSIVSAVPLFSDVALDGGNVTGTVALPNGFTLDASSISVQLYADGIAAGAAVTAATDGSFTIPTTGTAGAALSLRASISGTSSSVALSGPLSRFVPTLTAPTEIVSASLVASGSSTWTLSASWKTGSGEPIATYSVVAMQGSTTLQTWTITGNSFSDTMPAFTTTSPVTLVVTPQGNYGTGPASAAATFLAVAPGSVSAVSDGATVTVRWSAPTGAPSGAVYRLRLMQSGNTIAAAEAASGSTALIAIPSTAIDPTAQYGVTIDLGVGNAWTSANSVISIIASAPNVTAAAFAASDGSFTATWDGVTGAGAYAVELRSATAAVVQQTVSSATITIESNDLPASGVYELRVQPLGSASSNAIWGPWSALLPIAIVPPAGVTVAWDGRTASIAWQPVASSAISGYIVTILEGMTSFATQWTTANDASIAVAYDSNKTLNVVVQAVTSAGAGQPSAQQALFQTGWYASTDSAKAPYLRPAVAPAMASYAIVVYLPNIFATSVSSGLPTTPPFVFGVASPPFAYTLTMPGNSAVWTFDANNYRTAVSGAYATLLSDLVSLGVTALGWRTVQDAIARAMPQTFAETLYYGCGLVPNDGIIDLKAGMVLRLEYESYQYLGPGHSNSDLLDGFVASNSAEYEVGSYVDPNGKWLTGFDQFLSLVTFSGSLVPAPAVHPSGTSGGGGVIDNYFAQFRQPFVRLVYPPSILADSESDPQPAFNVALLAANDYPTLNTATQNLRDAQPLGPGVAVLYFRGRTMLTPCIRVWVDDAPLTVPVGTSVGNLLEMMGRRPPILYSGTASSSGFPMSGITLVRAIGNAVTSANAGTDGYPVALGVPIHLDWYQGMAYSAHTDWLSLPLFPGDRLTTGGPG
jgi:hypothetical protein